MASPSGTPPSRASDVNDVRRRARFYWPRRRTLWIVFLLLPAALIMSVFVIWPLLSALRLSFYGFNGLRPAEFIGFENFRRVLMERPFSDWTYNAFGNNVIVFFALMIFENGTAILLAF